MREKNMDTNYKIAIIVTWFGPLPPYFDAWLLSAENNSNIDFLVFCDHEFISQSSNIHFWKTTLQDTVTLCEKKLNRKVRFENSYKFCDARLFFGKIYEDYIRGYDFWGYCDIDLMFGNIRHFLTDDILKKHERLFQYGHLCLYRNNGKMNNLYQLPGGIYTLDEIFTGKAKTTPEEYYGANRICEKNNIDWYTDLVFADLDVRYPNSLQLFHGLSNYDRQIFVWNKGKVKRIYELDGTIYDEEFVYCHWQKRKPTIEGNIRETQIAIITPQKLIAVDKYALEQPNFEKMNPQMTEEEKRNLNKEYVYKKMKEFLDSSFATKKVWIRQKVYGKIDGKRSYG